MTTGNPLSLPMTSFVQRDVTVYSFTVGADMLMSLAQVERFGESSDGVNRKFDERHAMRIAEAMIEPDTVMLDSICGDLKGNWIIEAGRLTPGEGAYISIDDGQHRLAALEVLNPEERERWSFPVIATRGVPYKRRLKIFRQQKLRKPIDSRLDLAQRHDLGEWNTEAEQAAYELILQLNSDQGSPLKGQIILEETVRRPYEGRHREAGINAAGLWTTLKSAMGKSSPLFTLSMELRAEVVRNMIRLASEVWEPAWRSDKHILTTARGINAVLSLMVSGLNFRSIIGHDFTVESLRVGLEYGRKFNWHRDRHKNASVREIAEALDRVIGSARRRDAEATIKA